MRQVGRYVLNDLVADNGGSQFWRGTDPVLDRPVGIRLISIEHPRLAEITAAALAAAGVHDHRIVRVLDVIETSAKLAVISEWVEGRPWSELLRESDQSHEAAVVAYEVGRALQAAHLQGVEHGRLRPSSVIITENGQVRVRGLGVDCALYGVDPGTDPVAADLHGVGALLFVGLTRHWPSISQEHETIDNLPIVGPAGGRLPTPAEVASGVPAPLSRLASRCFVADAVPKHVQPFMHLDQAVVALSQQVDNPEARLAPAPEPRRSKSDRFLVRLAIGVVACLAVVTAIAVAWPTTNQPYRPLAGSTVASPTSSPEAPTLSPVSIAEARDYDPDGSDHAENPELVPLAFDGNLETAWRTVNYRTAMMSPKTGTGLMLDLGLTRTISTVELNLLGSGTDFTVLVSSQPDPTTFAEFAGAIAAPADMTVRAPIPVQARYVLIWLTSLPFQDGTYVGGVREVRVLG